MSNKETKQDLAAQVATIESRMSAMYADKLRHRDEVILDLNEQICSLSESLLTELQAKADAIALYEMEKAKCVAAEERVRQLEEEVSRLKTSFSSVS